MVSLPVQHALLHPVFPWEGTDGPLWVALLIFYFVFVPLFVLFMGALAFLTFKLFRRFRRRSADGRVTTGKTDY
jgi:hypothetical protein